ncbi:hypothetical protein [Staphylococcus shinii]|uniref:hypothetical protein n=1 Tax=Staphylococcus shinii TaxID=2912228 RepID=UPI003519A3DB
MSKYILSYNLNSILYGYEKLPAQLKSLGNALYIYSGLWFLQSDLDKNTICESIKTSFNDTDDFLIFEIEQSPLGTLNAQKYSEIQKLLDA